MDGGWFGHLATAHGYQGEQSLHAVLVWFLTEDLFYIFDLVGTLAFAVTGALVTARYAQQDGDCRIDLLGIVIGGIATAIGGGTIRCLLSGEMPFVLRCVEYLFIAITGSLLAALAYRWISRTETLWELLDAVGMGTFCAIGARYAYMHDFHPVIAVGFAVLTCIGGGVCRDVIISRTPSSFSTKFYGATSAIAGIAFVIMTEWTHLTIPQVMYLTLAIGFTTRVLSLWVFDWGLPQMDTIQGRLTWPERTPRLRAVHMMCVLQRTYAACLAGIKSLRQLVRQTVQFLSLFF